jgi:predicted aldo/keto reductase-like oxidoreductase
MIPTRRFGRTGLAMPVFSCGGMRYQESWEDLPPEKIPEANQKNLEATIHRSLELGINHIETARGYGTSEYQLGKVLPTIPREKLIVQTKIAPDRSGDEFLKTFETSMANLRLDHVDLLSLHGINTDELLENSLRPGGPLEAARRLQRDGRVRFIGFSTHGPTDVIVRTIDTGEFDYVNLHWYWVNQINWPAIEAATRHDMGVFIISPNDKGGKLYEPPEKLVRLCAPLSPMAFNNLFCLLRPEVHTLSLGAARPSDFDEHIRSLNRWNDAPRLVSEIDARLHAALAEPLGADWARGIPRWEEIPGGVNVWEILRLWVLAQGLDMVAFGKMRYNLLGQGGHWFPGKNAAEFDEEALRAAVSASPLADRIPELLREAHTLFFEKPAQRLGRD